MSSDEFITLTEASKLLPDRPSIATLWRWATKGRRGIKLKHIWSTKRFTTKAWLDEFLTATAPDTAEPVIEEQKPHRVSRSRAIADAERELEQE